MSFIASMTRKPVDKKSVRKFRTEVIIAWEGVRSKARSLCDQKGTKNIHFDFDDLHVNQKEVKEMRKLLAAATTLEFVDVSDAILILAIEDELSEMMKRFKLEITIDTKGFLFFRQK